MTNSAPRVGEHLNFISGALVLIICLNYVLTLSNLRTYFGLHTGNGDFIVRRCINPKYDSCPVSNTQRFNSWIYCSPGRRWLGDRGDRYWSGMPNMQVQCQWQLLLSPSCCPSSGTFLDLITLETHAEDCDGTQVTMRIVFRLIFWWHLGGIFTGPVWIRVRYNFFNRNPRSQFRHISQQY